MILPKRSRRQPTFRTVWATLDRAALRQEEADKRFNERLDRMAEQLDRMAEQRKEADQRFDEQRKEADQRFDEQRKEADQRFDEQRKEADQRFDEQRKEADKRFDEQFDRMAEQQREVDKRLDRMARQQEETQKALGQLSNRLGQIVEHIMAPNLKEKFAAFGYCFSQMAADFYINDARHGIALEIDAFLENGDCAVAVEVKVKPNIDDVNRHIKRMEKLRTYADTRHDRRQFYGAIAGTVITQMVKEYVLDQGLYLIEPSGEDVVVVPPHGLPKAW